MIYFFIIDTPQMVNPWSEIHFLCIFLDELRTPNAGTIKVQISIDEINTVEYSTVLRYTII